MTKLSKLLKSDKGDANYMSTVVFIFIAVILLAFIINLFGIISTKQQLGGFWNFDLVNITVVARGAGVSEHYWKDGGSSH